jgi:hypothetical protein
MCSPILQSVIRKDKLDALIYLIKLFDSSNDSLQGVVFMLVITKEIKDPSTNLCFQWLKIKGITM